MLGPTDDVVEGVRRAVAAGAAAREGAGGGAVKTRDTADLTEEEAAFFRELLPHRNLYMVSRLDPPAHHFYVDAAHRGSRHAFMYRGGGVGRMRRLPTLARGPCCACHCSRRFEAACRAPAREVEAMAREITADVCRSLPGVEIGELTYCGYLQGASVTELIVRTPVGVTAAGALASEIAAEAAALREGAAAGVAPPGRSAVDLLDLECMLSCLTPSPAASASRGGAGVGGGDVASPLLGWEAVAAMQGGGEALRYAPDPRAGEGARAVQIATSSLLFDEDGSLLNGDDWLAEGHVTIARTSLGSLRPRRESRWLEWSPRSPGSLVLDAAAGGGGGGAAAARALEGLIDAARAALAPAYVPPIRRILFVQGAGEYPPGYREVRRFAVAVRRPGGGGGGGTNADG